MNRARSEIDRLTAHIRKGCLSGLKPGEGTESNERLHNTLNKSLLCGATTVGPEIAIAIISLIFYVINCKKCGKKHEQNARIVPFVPPIKLGLDSNDDKGIHFNSALAQARGFPVQEIADAKGAKTRKSTKNLTEPKATCLANVESTR